MRVADELGRGLMALTVALALLPCCSRDPWHRKDAHAYCAPMLNEELFAPERTCRAVGVCANEANLTPDEKGKLEEMIRELGCTPP